MYTGLVNFAIILCVM